jgi:DNA polymerase-3 subunit chi
VTTIDFYHQVDDKHDFVRRLCAKALATRSKLMLWPADQEACRRLSRLLWSVPATGFVPHVTAGDPLAELTPIILDSEPARFPHEQVLVNLRAEVPPFFSRFERLVEIVSVDEEDAREARNRFRYYRDRGYELRPHDMRNVTAIPG